MPKKWTTTAADGEVDIRMEPEGPGSWPATTVFQAFEETVKKYGDRPALHFKRVPRVRGNVLWVGVWCGFCVCVYGYTAS